MASFIEQGENFEGSEIVLIDLDEERLLVVRTMAEKMARARGVDLRVSCTTNRRTGLASCDAVLTSFRAGGFEARHIDESIPLKHGVIGQETQGPGGFFMALRSRHPFIPGNTPAEREKASGCGHDARRPRWSNPPHGAGQRGRAPGTWLYA
jgi:alpha-galactosidase/6-phospho-beta-glucosidase family protein